MKTIRYLLLFSIIAFACTKKEPVGNVSKLKLSKIDSPLNISEIASKFKVLEIQSKTPISGLPNIFIGPSTIYLFDRDYSRSLYQIDQNGEIKNILHFGEDERINNNSITNIIIKEGNVGITLNGDNLLWLDENLQELSAEKLLVQGMFQFPFNDDYITFTNSVNESHPWDFIIYNNDHIKTKALPINKDKYKFVYKPQSPFSIWKKDQVVFSKQFNDTVYVYGKNELLSPLFIVDFENNKVPDDEFIRIKNAMDMMKFIGQKKYAYLSGEIFTLSDDKILLEYIDKENRKLGIWNENKNTFTTYPSIKDDILSNITLYTPSVVKDKQLAFGVTGESILENYNELSPTFKSNLSEDYATSYFIFLADLK